MKKFGRVGALFSSLLIISVVLGNLSLPVLAYEKNGVNFEQVKTGKVLDTNETIFNKRNALSEESKNFSLDSSKIIKEKKGAEKRNYVEGEILVKYKSDKINLNTPSGRTAALNFVRGKSLEKKEDLIKHNTSVLRIKDTKTVEQKVAELKNDPNVEYAQPNFQYYPAVIDTNDTDRVLLWGLDNTGQTAGGTYTTNNPGSDDKDIDAPEAWAINEGTNASIIVAVIDSGVAYNHPDLIANMWDGISCKDENGATLGGGCNHGYDYEDGDNIPLPTTSSHGTHIAGTIAAEMNNNKGIIGVAPQAKIMAIKTSLTTTDNVKSINFAKQNGAKVINASWGQYGTTNNDAYDFALYNAIKDFPGLFVASAGNENFNHDDGVDAHKHYPDGFKLTTSIGPGLDNIITVAATDQNDALASFSDYGATSVDVGAPGVNIYSTIADSSAMSENFDSVTASSLPSGWIKDGTNNKWATYDFSGDNVLYGQVPSFPYDNDTNSTVTSPIYNLGGGSGATISFLTKCDTEYTTEEWFDYMALEVSSDGVAFGELLRWDEAVLDILNGDSSDVGGAVYYFDNLSIPNQYLSSGFQFRLRWFADPFVNNFDGCWVDDIEITKFSDGSDEGYDYSDGTSMAAPHVAGLVALVWGYKPELNYTEVKDTILTTGDDLSSLNGKTATGKRINAFNALNSLIPTTHTISGTIKYYDGVKAVPSASVILEDGVGAHIATTTTDGNGLYQFTDVVGGSNYVVRVSKDDGASGLTGTDQTKIRRHIVGLEPFDTIYKNIAGDVNNSGSLTGTDQTKIRRFIVGLDNSLPSGAWKFYSSSAVLDAINYLTLGLTRIFTNLTADASGQNFVGVKMGDVNNSWVNN